MKSVISFEFTGRSIEADPSWINYRRAELSLLLASLFNPDAEDIPPGIEIEILQRSKSLSDYGILSIYEPDTIYTFIIKVLEPIKTISLGVVSAWLYDKLKDTGMDVKITIGGKWVARDEKEIRKAIEKSINF